MPGFIVTIRTEIVGMNSFRGKVALCITVTAFAGIGAYHLWRSRKRRAKANKTDDAADLVTIFISRCLSININNLFLFGR